MYTPWLYTFVSEIKKRSLKECLRKNCLFFEISVISFHSHFFINVAPDTLIIKLSNFILPLPLISTFLLVIPKIYNLKFVPFHLLLMWVVILLISRKETFF